jgi:hypothetical protein
MANHIELGEWTKMTTSIQQGFIGIAFFLVSSVLVFASEVTLREVTPQAAFFSNISQLCGARFEGKSVFPEDPGDAFRDQRLVAVVKNCTDEVIRISFAVGEDTSRTWVLSRVANGLELKHDHRHADGSADDITMYGGTSKRPGTALKQSFPADQYTAKLIPAAASNEWFLTLSPDSRELTYYLERDGKARFKAILFRTHD